MPRFLITGATGFIGGHFAHACVQRGYQTTALVRPDSKADHLRDIGVSLRRSEFVVPALQHALEDADIVVHCAAVDIDGLRNFLDACKGQALARFVHMSCSTVYAARAQHGTTEDQSLPRHSHPEWRRQVDAEQLALRYYRDFGVPVAVLRPGLVYGPRERLFLPWLIERLRQGKLRYLGDRRKAAAVIFIRNLIDAVFLAADNVTAVGRAYNLTDGEFISKQRFIEAAAQSLDLPPPRSALPVWLARLLRTEQDPAYRRFLAQHADLSINRAREDFGYRPRVPFDDAIAETMAWFKQSQVAYWRKSALP